jgi:hypothetical protein
MEKSPAVTFASSHFQVEPGEDAKTNPGIYGQALARWIAAQLGESGVGAKGVVAEDWGWCVIVKTEPVRLCLAVANVDGTSTRWRVFAFAERGPLQWLSRSGDPKREVAALREHLAALLSSVPDVRDISWEALP